MAQQIRAEPVGNAMTVAVGVAVDQRDGVREGDLLAVIEPAGAARS